MADDVERDYYRRIEDFFSELRGVPHLLSPKDFQILRGWWHDSVPLEAVLAGLTEVFEKKRARGDTDPVTSLSYCRHAVRRHAERLAEARVGASEGDTSDERVVGAQLAALGDRLASAAQAQRDHRPRVTDVLLRVADQLRGLAGDDPAADAAETALMSLEELLLTSIKRAMDPTELDRIQADARRRARSSGVSGAALERAAHAHTDRRLRELFDLPRLELV